MKIKSLIAVSIIAPLLALSLAARAGTCPTPEDFEKRQLYDGGHASVIAFADQSKDFALNEKPIDFVGAVFMSSDESDAKLRYGKLYACLYTIANGTNKYALLRQGKNKIASIAADSEDWIAVRKNRYDCKADNVEACQFNLYYKK